MAPLRRRPMSKNETVVSRLYAQRRGGRGGLEPVRQEAVDLAGQPMGELLGGQRTERLAGSSGSRPRRRRDGRERQRATARARAARSGRRTVFMTGRMRPGPHRTTPRWSHPPGTRTAARALAARSSVATTLPRVRRNRQPGHAPPGRPHRSLQPSDLPLAGDEVAADRLGLRLGQLVAVLDQEGPGHRRGDLGIVHEAEVVLQADHPGDQRSGLRTERLAHELEGVAQALGRDPELMEGRHVRPAQDRLVGPDVLVGRPDPRRGRVPDAVRDRRLHRRDIAAGTRHELDVLVDEPAVALRVQLVDQPGAGRVPVAAPAGQESTCAPPPRSRPPPARPSGTASTPPATGRPTTPCGGSSSPG